MKTFIIFSIFATFSIVYCNEQHARHLWSEIDRIHLECKNDPTQVNESTEGLDCAHLCVSRKLGIIKNGKFEHDRFLDFFKPHLFNDTRVADFKINVADCRDEVKIHDTDCKVEHHLRECLKKALKKILATQPEVQVVDGTK